MIVVSAPAGYGKSTLAVDWLAEVGLPACWLSLDRQDRDPLALLANLTSAVRGIAPDELQAFAERLENVGERADPSALVSEFAAVIHQSVDELFILVVDDLNALEGADAALELLDTLAQGLPLSMRLVVLTRSWTLLPSLPRLTAQRRALSLTVRDLQFSDDEALELLRVLGVTEGVAQASVIRRADGWAAALAILGEHADPTRPSDTSASEFILADFVDQEVLARLASEQLDLLESCAVLQSFDVPLVRELSGHSDAARRLRERRARYPSDSSTRGRELVPHPFHPP